MGLFILSKPASINAEVFFRMIVLQYIIIPWYLYTLVYKVYALLYHVWGQFYASGHFEIQSFNASSGTVQLDAAYEALNYK